jgi:hypothetical protein
MTTTSDFFSDAIFFFALLILFYAELASSLLDHDCAGMNNLSVTHRRGEGLAPALAVLLPVSSEVN